MVVTLALRQGRRPGVLELLHLLGLAALRHRDRQRAALGLRPAERRDPARRGLPPPRRARGHERPPRRTSATRSRATPSIEVVGFISLTPRPDNGMRSLGQLDELGEIIEREGIDEVIIADPAFPDREAARARRRLPRARRARADRAVDDGDPRQARRLRARPDAAALRAALAGLRGLRLHRQARVRPRRRGAADDLPEPGARAQRARRQADLARAGLLPLVAARASAARRSPA